MIALCPKCIDGLAPEFVVCSGCGLTREEVKAERDRRVQTMGPRLEAHTGVNAPPFSKWRKGDRVLCHVEPDSYEGTLVLDNEPADLMCTVTCPKLLNGEPYAWGIANTEWLGRDEPIAPPVESSTTHVHTPAQERYFVGNRRLQVVDQSLSEPGYSHCVDVLICATCGSLYVEKS